MFDYFVSELHCPHCAAVNGMAANTNMQTHIRGSYANGTQLAASFVFDEKTLTSESLIDAGYAAISLPEEPQSPRLLDVWVCPVCKTEQWATIEIVHRRIERISAVVLDRTSFELSNYIDATNAELEAAALMGMSWNEFSGRKLSPVDVLRQRLE